MAHTQDMGLVQHHAVKGGGDGLQGPFHTAQKFSLGERISRLLFGIPIAALPGRSILQGLNRKAHALFVGLPGFPLPQGLCLAGTALFHGGILPLLPLAPRSPWGWPRGRNSRQGVTLIIVSYN